MAHKTENKPKLFLSAVLGVIFALLIHYFFVAGISIHWIFQLVIAFVMFMISSGFFAKYVFKADC